MKLMLLVKTIFENASFQRVIFENIFWLLEQPANNKSYSSIRFLLGEFYQEYKNVLLRFLGPKSFRKFY